MKTITKWLSVLVLSFVCCGRLEGAIAGLELGSLEKVMHHSITSVEYTEVYVYQKGHWNEPVGWLATITPKFKDKKELDTFFQSELKKCVPGALTNTSAATKRDDSFIIEAYASDSDSGTYFGVKTEFKLIKSPSGTYSLPDLSKIVLGFPIDIAYKVNALSWARIEALDENGVLKEQPTWVNTEFSYLFIPTAKAIAGTNAIHQINLVSGEGNDFQVLNGDGKQIAEQLPTTKVSSDESVLAESKKQALKKPSSISPKFITVQRNGGEIGRVFVLQSSSSITGSWEDIVDTEHSVSARYTEGSFTFFDETIGVNKFYRIRSVNKVPFRNDR